jgi:hypothetical protein
MSRPTGIGSPTTAPSLRDPSPAVHDISGEHRYSAEPLPTTAVCPQPSPQVRTARSPSRPVPVRRIQVCRGSVLAVLSLPLLFAAGRSVSDTADSMPMIRAYRSPARKLHDNIATAAAMTVAVASLIASAYLASLITDVTGAGSALCSHWYFARSPGLESRMVRCADSASTSSIGRLDAFPPVGGPDGHSAFSPGRMFWYRTGLRRFTATKARSSLRRGRLQIH